ncbi:hypothetical protein BS47DRAFT_446534 [Hydnum rufescens UP504]|uniref:Uncharacterized protein n=1 Tax=Hydnum rufescens UP504 TaxID=1448309 RepID=A0A9P6E134_9AGAM|nr:hypothetical protein BS47DRAFT_446534 [Hydnum rufescens UP504]
MCSFPSLLFTSTMQTTQAESIAPPKPPRVYKYEQPGCYGTLSEVRLCLGRRTPANAARWYQLVCPPPQESLTSI